MTLALGTEMDRRDVMDTLLRLRRYAESGRDDAMEAKDLVALGTILTNMSQHFISRAKQRLDSEAPTRIVVTAEIEEARQELEEARRATEEAADAILSSAERLMSLDDCALEVSEEAMGIMTACSFQDLAGQRMSKVADVLLRMEERGGGGVREESNVLPLGSHPTDALAQGPVNEGDGLDQSAIDDLLEAV